MARRNHPGMAAEARRVMARSRATRLEDQGQIAIPLGRSFPTRAPAVVEQVVAPIPTTLQHGYEVWRQSEIGEAVFYAARARALQLAATGTKRIGVKALFEWIRATQMIECNNTWTAFVARELREREPVLRTLIECRERKST